MRIIHQAQYILIGLAAFFFTACSQEEIEQTKEVKRSELRVLVSHPDAADTRATINGISTTFEEGDLIGFFAINTNSDNYNVVYYNIPLTFDGNEWKPFDENVKLFHSPSYVYYAYYPYQEEPNGWINEYQETAEGFFGEIINQWEPKLDQSELEDYLASDLMVGKGVTTTNDDLSGTVRFSLEHQMGLLLIELYSEAGGPINAGDLNQNEKYFDDYFKVDLNETFYSIPYNDGIYFRYIGKPDTDYKFSYSTAESGITENTYTLLDERGMMIRKQIFGLQVFVDPFP
ncbi:MAG: fimbrillin family protein [Prevotella sp.]|nr:fimbrillin family protein [Prevotella sp.]